MKLATPQFLEAGQYFKSLATMSHAPQLKSAFGIAYANAIGKHFEIDTEKHMETVKGAIFNHVQHFHFIIRWWTGCYFNYILSLFTVLTTVLSGVMSELQYKRIQVTMVIVHAQICKDPADMKTWSGHTKLVSLLTSLQTFAVTCYKIIGKPMTMEIICKFYFIICV